VEDSVLTIDPDAAAPKPTGPYAIVLGNAKGGTGKSTAAIHVTLALMRRRYRVGTIDLDAQQGTLTHFLENRRAHSQTSGHRLNMPSYRQVDPSRLSRREEAEADEAARLATAVTSLASCDFIVIDTAGSDNNLSRLGHAHADTLITPLNDSLFDIDVLARIDVGRREVLAPSNYTQLVWEANNQRVLRGLTPIDWIVMRNRLAHIDARNMRDVGDLLERLAHRIGFRLAPGFGERVVFRELFDRGLTVLDLPGSDELAPASHRAARREVDILVRAIGLVAVDA
jgi:chromosome partitioning protein